MCYVIKMILRVRVYFTSVSRLRATPVTRRIRRANSNWPPFEFAAGLHLDDGYRATRVPPLLSHLPTTARASTPPTPASPHTPSPPSPFSLPLAVHASLRLVLRCRMGNAVSPPKRVSCPPSRAFQSVFCHLEVCVVTRSRLFALGVSPSGVRKGKRKRERIKKVWSSNKLIFVRYTVIRT